MKKSWIQWRLILLGLVVGSCATYTSKVKVGSNSPNYPLDKQLDHRFFLIGDAGLSKNGKPSDALTIFQNAVSKSTKNDVVLFLGDNIYPNGLPEVGEPGRADAEFQLNTQLSAVKDAKAQVMFIPGNHDWYSGGIPGLERQEEFIESVIQQKKVFLPSDACGLEDVDISESVHLIIIDSEWFLEDWDKHPTVNDDCEIKTRKKFYEEFEGMLKKNEGKTVIVAIHHPLNTYGTHGGYFSADKHLFPFQNKVPLPVIGSLITQVRKTGGVSVQDIQNQRYKVLRDRLEAIAMVAPANVIFTSGHDHSMQYIENDNYKQLIAGSGSKESPTKLTGDALFVSGKQGYATLDVFKDGSVWARFYTARNGQPNLEFQKEVYPTQEDQYVDDFPKEYPQHVMSSIYPTDETIKSKGYQKFWGEHYRELYGTQIKARVALLDTLYGGLTPVRKGGGHQTRTLRLEDPQGREYNMRAVKKSAVQFLQKVVLKDHKLSIDDLSETLPESLLMDYYTASYPYAAYPVSELSKAVELYHTNPELFYIPKQQRLGKYNAEYGDELYLIEERPAKEHQNVASFGNAEDIESTDDLFKKLRKDEENVLDENAYIRARLFDMLIGDWDRHGDQWRWAEFKGEEQTVYRSIPRDRDQAFADFDGSFLAVVRALMAPAKMLQPYGPEIDHLRWINTEPLPMDRALIRNSDQEDWVREAKFIQYHLTEQVIDQAFMTVPAEVREETMKKVKPLLMQRLDGLVTTAKDYYKLVDKVAILHATDKDDYIEVIRSGPKETRVVIRRIKKGEKADLIVDKTYHKDVTKELWIYGLDDKDVFEVKGQGKQPILVRLIGGQNRDTYKIRYGKKVRFYDFKSKDNIVELNNGGTKRFTDKYDNNIFTFGKSNYSTYTLLPSLGYNADAGFIAGVNYAITNYGFERNPFSSKHSLGVNFHFATSGIELKYDGESSGIFHKLNLAYGLKYNSPTYARNFFGFGNQTTNLEDDLGKDYYRTNWSNLRGYLGLVKRSEYGGVLSAKAIFEGAQVEDTQNRYITTFNPDASFFDWHYFATAEIGFEYESYDIPVNPSRGMYFKTTLGYTLNLSGSNTSFAYLNPQITFYNPLSQNHRWVLKTNVQSQLNFGDDFEFYQAPYLGGNSGLRGYRINRFTGNKSLVFNGDIRHTFNAFKTPILPVNLGVYGGVDLGRVWVKDEDSKQWHNSVGGGVFVVASELVNLDLSYFNSKEGNRFTLGFRASF
ncbi:metallophosphoesterase [Galbibacter sp.]|uniref:metallophosphoesterase n=1 Tax=Galbibacter sp. TaxID=2918471 RepID=UPI003A9400A0